ncbi:MAG: hypothetical protein ACR2OC_05335 [Solirubrobacterales bacterium]
MADLRAKRFANNEALFREGNERMSKWEERQDSDEAQKYLCECANPACREKIRLTSVEYSSVRDNSRRFAVVPGHEILDVETVVDQHPGWLLVEKDPEPEITAIVEERDERNPRGS